MRTSASDLAIWFVGRFPSFSKWWLRKWAGYYQGISGKPHWLLLRLTDHLGYRIPVRLRLGNGMPIVVSWRDFVGEQIRLTGFFEHQTIDVLRACLRPGFVFFDVGAHVGQYTLLGSSWVGDSGEVHSFEPDPETFALLETNVRLNRLRNVQLNKIALSDEVGSKPLFQAGLNNPGANSLVPQGKHEGEKHIQVSVSTLDDYVRLKGIPRIDFLKVDIEGEELRFLRGATILAKWTPPLIIEFNQASLIAAGSSCRMLAGCLTQMGYVLYRIGNWPLCKYEENDSDGSVFNVLALTSHGRKAWSANRSPSDALMFDSTRS